MNSRHMHFLGVMQNIWLANVFVYVWYNYEVIFSWFSDVLEICSDVRY